MTFETSDGERWLAAATTGGLPEPRSSRWQPLRVGIVNLWEYDRAEFWFADGRLVLRGGNGAGKTKVLELTTLMLLRGEIGPSVLDPFGSQHRTMRFNLLPTGEDDDPRAASDAGLGYAWTEFGRVRDDGEAEYFVCGLGASARRGSGTSGVTPWRLVTRRRPGSDLDLCPGGRPLDQRELKKLADVEVPETAGRYRAMLADELFGLGADAYDNLTELLKQLRRPKLGERLNPASLAETLRAALPPLAGSELAQLADGWDNLEKLRTKVAETRSAAVHLTEFVRTGWSPWARTLVRVRADTLASATTDLDDTTKKRRAAETELTGARQAVRDLEKHLSVARADRQDHETELRELLESPAYQDALAASGRVESLQSQVDELTRQRDAGRRRLAGAEAETAAAAAAARDATETAEEAAAATVRAAETVRSTGRPAGLDASADRHLLGHDVAALRADLGTRRERFDRLRGLRRAYDHAAEAADRSADVLAARRSEAEEAVGRRDQASVDLTDAVDTLRTRIREWNAATAVVRADDRLVEDWCDLVAELTADAAEVDAGRVPGSPAVAIRRHIDGVRDRLRTDRDRMVHRRDGLRQEQDAVAAELDEVSRSTEQPPDPPTGWRRRDRPAADEGRGAAFWRCVQPVAGNAAADLDRLEATLQAAGLLDAWLAPDGRLSDGEGDTFVLGGRPVGAASLRDVLEPTPSGGVTGGMINGVLAAVGWHPERPADDDTGTWLAADGTWRTGRLTGMAEAVRPASYLGATAREAARLRRIAELEARLAALETAVAEVDGSLVAVTAQLGRLTEEEARAPDERPVTDAVATLRDREHQAEQQQGKAQRAEDVHRERETARDRDWAAFSRFAGDHAFPLENLDAHDHALRAYAAAVDALASALRLFETELRARERSVDHLVAAESRRSAEESDLGGVRGRLRQREVSLRTAEQALTTDTRARLDRRKELDGLLDGAETTIDGLGEELRTAGAAVAGAEITLERHEERRQAAEGERDAALAAWWEAFDAGLGQPAGLEEPARRTVEAARDTTRAARRELRAAGDVDRAWRTCFARLQELRQHLLPDRDVRVRDGEDTGTVQRVQVLADSAAGWQEPGLAADLLAHQVREQEATFDAEQQRVLTTLLESTFIEHLKDRLDYTARTFDDINKQLVSHPTRHGNAVRLRWEPDQADQDAGTVVDALAQGYQQLSPTRQQAVRSFLARRIDAARADAAAEAADWRETLAVALDYRRWLRITLQYRPGAASKWLPFDAARHGAKSGGEKVVLLSQPLFAAAVVAYNAAGDHAPRWVWLDEAMTGVDDEIKASFMGLTVSFDLDVMLTAHDEWCKYRTVPAVAVYDLARHKGLPGVDVMPYLWRGGEWTAVPMLSAERRDEQTERLAEGLFAPTDDEDP